MTGNVNDSGDPPEGVPSSGVHGDSDPQQSPAGDLGFSTALLSFGFILQISTPIANAPPPSTNVLNYFSSIAAPLNAVLNIVGGQVYNPASVSHNIPESGDYGTNLATGYTVWGPLSIPPTISSTTPLFAVTAGGVLNPQNLSFLPAQSQLTAPAYLGPIGDNGTSGQLLGVSMPLDVTVTALVYMRPGVWQINVNQSFNIETPSGVSSYANASTNQGSVYVGSQLVATLTNNGIAQSTGQDAAQYSYQVNVTVGPNGAYITLVMNGFEADKLGQTETNQFGTFSLAQAAQVEVVCTFIHI